ncbi:MAG: hypothetical protein RIQ33_1986, partial [Bacteroidota bacterium]
MFLIGNSPKPIAKSTNPISSIINYINKIILPVG